MSSSGNFDTLHADSYNFDQYVERRGSDSAKWGVYGDDVLPLWVADMDFPSPPAVLEALHQRVDHGIFGYGMEPLALKELICERMARLHRWQISPDDILFLPGLVCGLNVVTRAIGEPGDAVVVSTPVYPPFLTAPGNQDRRLQTADLAVSQVRHQDRLHPRYEFDPDAFQAALDERTRLFILCNPHNPVGRAFTPAELSTMAELCARHDLVICSDEIHCDLLMGETRHVPIASLDPEIAARTITLVAPSKTYNIPGLGCSMAIVPNADLRRRLERAKAGIVPHINVMGFVAALAAYREGDAWLSALLAYLTANRDFAVDYLARHMPQLKTTVPEATYLLWIDCREAHLPAKPQQFFLEEAKVALNDGAAFGPAGEGFVRLNYGCPRATLEEALARMARALQG
ncbi:PatB family C-S lyase [Litorilinea aerophila]|uniref:MalY/PatB family protein n=1 Tax=Litorilinea aerophila TaxID=1204385 RepID=UPI00147757EE|nr:PatB family C-S lyase [Litorilinea aerophila]MCC9075043.1 PatB family C-S lyase [Litorilinea aerophila]GIV79829.1 MAG: aminotransferase class I/II [Litorilinea sp.]